MDNARRKSIGMLALLAPAALMTLKPDESEAANVAFPTYAFTATGGTAARTTPARAGDLLSVKEFGCVGDGVTNDSANWTAAVASGKSLFVPPGTYILNMATVASPLSGQRIFGVPGQSILQKTMIAGTSYNTPFFKFTDVFDVTVDGLTINEVGAAARQYGFVMTATTLGSCGRIRIQNCTLKNAPNFIERFVDTVWINNNAFLGGGVNGAQHGCSMGGTIANNQDFGVVQNINITNNYFTQVRTEAIDVNWNAWNIVISGNLCVDCGLTGGQEAIDIGGGDATNFCKNIVVSNNVIVFNNLVNTGVNSKQYTQDLVISDNVIVNSSTAATSNGIHLSSYKTTVVEGNTIRGFSVGVTTTDPDAANPCEGLVVANNIITNPGTVGIQVWGSTGVTSDTVISGNRLKTNVVGGIKGINLLNATDFAITGNLIFGFTTNGIVGDANSNNGCVTGNYISGAGTSVAMAGTGVVSTGNTP